MHFLLLKNKVSCIKYLAIQVALKVLHKDLKQIGNVTVGTRVMAARLERSPRTPTVVGLLLASAQAIINLFIIHINNFC